MAATTPDGTDDEGIKRAALALGHGVDELAETEPTKAWARLYGALLMGRPVVLCVDKWSHWVCAVGLCGQRVLVAEPGRYPYATKENGLLVVNSKRLLKRWKAAYRTTGARGPAFYGLAIGPAE